MISVALTLYYVGTLNERCSEHFTPVYESISLAPAFLNSSQNELEMHRFKSFSRELNSKQVQCPLRKRDMSKNAFSQYARTYRRKKIQKRWDFAHYGKGYNMEKERCIRYLWTRL